MTDFINNVFRGDWVEIARDLPDGCVHTIVTSPPYWGQRNYGVEGQLGLEKTPEEHIEKLVDGGFLIIDDWNLMGCRAAVVDYFKVSDPEDFMLKFKVKRISGDDGPVYFRKVFQILPHDVERDLTESLLNMSDRCFNKIAIPEQLHKKPGDKIVFRKEG